MLKMPRSRPSIYKFIPRPIVNTFIGCFVLLVVAVAGGALYTWYMGKNAGHVESAVVGEPVSKKVNSIVPPTKPTPGANVGVAIHSFNTPVSPGSESSIIVRTTAEATCKIKVEYNKVPSKDAGLVDKVADEYGMVDWHWYVEESVPEGKWPVEIECGFAGKSGMVRGELEVKS